MTCQQTHELLHGYMDGELDLLHNVEIERHFGECEACAKKHQNQLALRSLIKENAPYFDAPDVLKKRLTEALRKGSRTSSPFTLSARRWLPIAAVIAILILSGVLAWTLLSTRTRPQTDNLVAEQIVSSHIRSLMADHLTDVPSSDQHTVKPWFDGKVDFAPQVKDLAEQGFPLAGGRLDYVDNRTVAALVYQRRKHYINLFIWQSGSPDQPQQQLSRQGYNVIHWTRSGTTYWAVSDVNATDLREFIELIKQ